MHEDEIATALRAIETRVAFFQGWLAEKGGVRGGFDNVCHCCGYLFLYFDRDFGDPCPICLAPLPAFDPVAGWLIADDTAHGERDIGVDEARRNYVLYGQIYPVGHWYHNPVSADGQRFAAAFDAALLIADAEVRERALRDVGDAYFKEAAAREGTRPASGY